jgi:hypothetical protein
VRKSPRKLAEQQKKLVNECKKKISNLPQQMSTFVSQHTMPQQDVEMK